MEGGKAEGTDLPNSSITSHISITSQMDMVDDLRIYVSQNKSWKKKKKKLSEN
jgi:hypothetical protein